MKRMILLAALVIPAAQAAETLTEVVSDVIEAPAMSASQIADRGEQCIKSVSGNVADTITTARDGDVAYAIVRTGVKRMMVVDIIRSRISVVGKDGRFKVAHSDVERFLEFGGGSWGAVQKYPGSGFDGIKKALEARSAAVAECITKPAAAPGGDNW